MRRLLFLILIFLGGLFVISNFAQIEKVSFAVRQGDRQVLFAAMLFVLLWLVNLAAIYRSIYRSLGVEENLLTLLIVSTASMFANIVTPGGLLGGVALFVDQATKRGYSIAKATLAGLMQLVFDLIGFMTVLVIGLFVLFRRDDLTATTVSASIILFLIAAFLLFLFVLGVQSGEKLSKALGMITRIINRLLRPIIKRDYLSEANAIARAREAANGLKEIHSDPRKLFWPYLLALNGKAIQIVIFWLIFVAFNVPFTVGTIIAGFCVAFLFMVVSPSPVGIGVVETLLPLTLRAMFVPLDSAVVITLAYRGMTLWLPMFFGMLCIRLVDFASRQPVVRAE